MKIYLLGVLVVVALAAATEDDKKFTTEYDNIDVDEVLSHERLYKKYLACLLGKGKCSPDGQTLKEAIPEALKTKCAPCSPKQKETSKKVIKFIIENHPEDFKQLEEMYDPEGIFRKEYEPEAKKLGIDLSSLEKS